MPESKDNSRCSSKPVVSPTAQAARSRWLVSASEAPPNEASIDTARADNAYVLLDLHWSDMGVWGSKNGQHFLPDDNSTAFWRDAAARWR